MKSWLLLALLSGSAMACAQTQMPTIPVPLASISGAGTAAAQNTGTSGANVPLLNGANTWGAAQTFPGGGILCGGVNAQVGTSYTVVASDGCKFVTLSNASAVAVTLPQATTAGFTTGFETIILNRGAGTVTITPTTSTINGSATLTLTTNQFTDIKSDGANFIATVPSGGSSGPSSIVAGSGLTGGGSTGAITVALGPTANSINFQSNLGGIAAQPGGISVSHGAWGGGDSNSVNFGGGTGSISYRQQECIDWGIPAGNTTGTSPPVDGLCVNAGIQSNTGADMAFQVFNLTNPTDTGNPLYLNTCCSNEGPTQGTVNTTAQYTELHGEMRAIYSYQTMGTSQFYPAYSDCTLSGAMAQDASTFAASKGVLTSTTGSCTIPNVLIGKGGVLDGYMYTFTSSTAQATITDITNSANVITLTDLITGNTTQIAQSQGRAAANTGSTSVRALKLVGPGNVALSPGYHTLKVTVTTSGNFGFIGFKAPNALLNSRGQTAPTLIAGNTIPTQFGFTDSIVQDVNTHMASWFAEARADGLNVYPADDYSGLDNIVAFNTNSPIGYTVSSLGSGQTPGTYQGTVTGAGCAGGIIPIFNYTIDSSGHLTQPPTPAMNTSNEAYSCTSAGTAVLSGSSGGTPAVVAPVWVSNIQGCIANSKPPFHLSSCGQTLVARTEENAAPVIANTISPGNCTSNGTQTLNGQCHTINMTSAGVITLPTNVSSPSLATQGITPGSIWNITNTSSGNVTFTGSTGGTAGLSFSQFVIPPNYVNNFGSQTPSGCSIQLVDTTGIYNVLSCTPNVVTPYPVQITNTKATNVTSVTCNTAACTVNRGTVTVVGGTQTTGVFNTVSWTATPSAYVCQVIPQGTAGSTYGITHSVATTTGMTISAANSISGATFTYDYECQP